MDLYYAYLRLLIAFPLVLILAYFGLRFFLSRFSPSLSGGRRIKVLERAPLNQKSFLYVVKVGNHYLLVASTASNVTLLKDLGTTWEEENLHLIEDFQESGEEAPVNFASVMEQVKKKVSWEGKTFSLSSLWNKVCPFKKNKH